MDENERNKLLRRWLIVLLVSVPLIILIAKDCDLPGSSGQWWTVRQGYLISAPVRVGRLGEAGARPADAGAVGWWLADRHRDYVGKEEEYNDRKLTCNGTDRTADIPADILTRELLESIQERQGCSYQVRTTWKNAKQGQHLRERRTVWADAEGLFHGKVEYWEDVKGHWLD